MKQINIIFEKYPNTKEQPASSGILFTKPRWDE